MFLKWSGKSPSSEALHRRSRKLSPQKAQAFIKEFHSFYSRFRRLSQQKAQALTLESHSIYTRSRQLSQEKTKALTVEGDPLLILKSTQLTARNL